MKFGLGILVLLALGACTPALPEADSEAAKLYVLHCSGANCHGAIPPERSTVKSWELQYDRMIVLMRNQGVPLPTAQEDALILDYLRRHADGAKAAE